MKQKGKVLRGNVGWHEMRDKTGFRKAPYCVYEWLVQCTDNRGEAQAYHGIMAFSHPNPSQLEALASVKFNKTYRTYPHL